MGKGCLTKRAEQDQKSSFVWYLKIRALLQDCQRLTCLLYNKLPNLILCARFCKLAFGFLLFARSDIQLIIAKHQSCFHAGGFQSRIPTKTFFAEALDLTDANHVYEEMNISFFS